MQVALVTMTHVQLQKIRLTGTVPTDLSPLKLLCRCFEFTDQATGDRNIRAEACAK